MLCKYLITEKKKKKIKVIKSKKKKNGENHIYLHNPVKSLASLYLGSNPITVNVKSLQSFLCNIKRPETAVIPKTSSVYGGKVTKKLLFFKTVSVLKQ